MLLLRKGEFQTLLEAKCWVYVFINELLWMKWMMANTVFYNFVILIYRPWRRREECSETLVLKERGKKEWQSNKYILFENVIIFLNFFIYSNLPLLKSRLLIRICFTPGCLLYRSYCLTSQCKIVCSLKIFMNLFIYQCFTKSAVERFRQAVANSVAFGGRWTEIGDNFKEWWRVTW